MEVQNPKIKIVTLAVAVMALIGCIWTIGRGGQTGSTQRQNNLKRTTLATISLLNGQTVRLDISNPRTTHQCNIRDAQIRLFEAQTGEVGLVPGQCRCNDSVCTDPAGSLGPEFAQGNAIVQVSLVEPPVKNKSDLVTFSVELVEKGGGDTTPTTGLLAESTFLRSQK